MLYDEFVQAEKRMMESKIERQFEDGEVNREALVEMVENRVGRLPKMLEVADWFERTHGDDLSKERYQVVKQDDDQFVDCPHRTLTNLFIHVLVNEDTDEGVASQFVWDADNERAAVVFESHDCWPNY